MKIGEFQEALKKKGIDFALFYNLDSTTYDADVAYFSGYKGIGALVIPAGKRPFLAVPEMEYEKAASGLKTLKWPKGKRLFEFISCVIARNKIKSRAIGINKNVFTLNVYKSLRKYFRKSRSIDIWELCEKTREIKTNREVRMIKKACSLADNIFCSLARGIKNKKIRTEVDAAAFLEEKARMQGCEMAFKPIVASGKASSIPHYDVSPSRLRKGFCVIDFGIRYKSYNCDMTRTIYIGKPSAKEKEIYYFLLEAQQHLISSIRSGDRCSALYSKMKKMLGKHSKNFIHGLGHGIGIKVHELPNLTEKSKDKVKRNMVFTVEPGLYFSGKFGIRIEDTILMGKRARVLTKATKDLLSV
jgi:Xaa-Pro aminopeptidase